MQTALRLIIYYTRRDGNVPCYHRAQEPEGKLVRRLQAPTIWKNAPCWHDPKPADQALGTIPILGDADLLQVHTPKGQLEAAAFKLLHRRPSEPFLRCICFFNQKSRVPIFDYFVQLCNHLVQISYR